MFRKPKIAKIICDAPIKRTIKKKEHELSEEAKEIQQKIKEIEEDENLDTIIETPISPNLQALVNSNLKETGKIYEDENGRKFKYIVATGLRKMGSQTVPYQYKKLYYIRDTKKRGPKKANNKILLRKLLTKLKDADCIKILNYISNNIRPVNNGCEDNKSNNTEQNAL